MDQEYFTKLSEMAKKAQEPLQAIIELNVKTLQSLSYLRPDELTSIKKPDQLLEKQLQLALENGHKGLEYLEKSFQIIEKAMLSCLKDAKNTKVDAKRSH